MTQLVKWRRQMTQVQWPIPVDGEDDPTSEMEKTNDLSSMADSGRWRR